MSDILSAIHDDMDSYQALCERFGEMPQTDEGGLMCYGPHAKKLESMADYLRRCEKYNEKPKKHLDGTLNHDGRHSKQLYRRENPPRKKEPGFQFSNREIKSLRRKMKELDNKRTQLKNEIEAAQKHIAEIQKACKHKWVNLGGFLAIEERCKRCDLSDLY